MKIYSHIVWNAKENEMKTTLNPQFKLVKQYYYYCLPAYCYYLLITCLGMRVCVWGDLHVCVSSGEGGLISHTHACIKYKPTLELAHHPPPHIPVIFQLAIVTF